MILNCKMPIDSQVVVYSMGRAVASGTISSLIGKTRSSTCRTMAAISGEWPDIEKRLGPVSSDESRSIF